MIWDWERGEGLDTWHPPSLSSRVARMGENQIWGVFPWLGAKGWVRAGLEGREGQRGVPQLPPPGHGTAVRSPTLFTLVFGMLTPPLWAPPPPLRQMSCASQTLYLVMTFLLCTFLTRCPLGHLQMIPLIFLGCWSRTKATTTSSCGRRRALPVFPF